MTSVTCAEEGCSETLSTRKGTGPLCKDHRIKKWFSENRDQANANRRRHDAAKKAVDPEFSLRKNLKTRYNMTVEDYYSLLEKQDGHCAMCPNTTYQPGHKWLGVDHDHSCCPGIKSCGKCVRGLLCHPCNTLLGAARDSLERLEEAARYLRTAPPVDRA